MILNNLDMPLFSNEKVRKVNSETLNNQCIFNQLLFKKGASNSIQNNSEKLYD